VSVRLLEQELVPLRCSLSTCFFPSTPLWVEKGVAPQLRTRYSMETLVSLTTFAHLSISAEMNAAYLSDDPPPGTYPDAA